MVSREARDQLYQALKGHKSGLETKREAASGPGLEILDRRIEDSQRLLEWLAQALELHPAAPPAVETPPPSRVPTDPDQISP
jgi:hypothetical protein